MKRMNEEQREILGKILGVIGTGAVLAAAVVAPNILLGLAPLIAKKSAVESRSAHQMLRYARRKQLIRVRETKGGVEVELTEDGRRRWQEIELTRPLQMAQWDGKWRIVIFDIPDTHKIARDTLRRVLRNLGFVQLQESVWVTPYPCLEHIEAARRLYAIGPYLRLITADDIEVEGELLAKFNLEA